MKSCESEDANGDNAKGISACDNKSHKVIKIPKKENSNAKNRWKLLARAIHTSHNKCDAKRKEKLPISNVSQDFSGFDLVQIEQLHKDDAETFMIKIDEFDCVVHIEKLWTMKDLIGFNNTGNITFWPSEAALTFYTLSELAMFHNSWVLELGGGMLCLAGLMLAKHSSAFAVHLTDGNESSLKNVRKSLNLNDTQCFVKTSGIVYVKTFVNRIPTEFQLSSQMGRGGKLFVGTSKIRFHFVRRLSLL